MASSFWRISLTLSLTFGNHFGRKYSIQTELSMRNIFSPFLDELIEGEGKLYFSF